MIDVGAASCILLILTAADRKISETEIEVIHNCLTVIGPPPSLSSLFDVNRVASPEELRRLASGYVSFTPEELARELKDNAIKIKSMSTLVERLNFLEWARKSIYADGNISGEERALFEFLSAIFGAGPDMDAMRQAQQQYTNASNYIQRQHQQFMTNLSMWRT